MGRAHAQWQPLHALSIAPVIAVVYLTMAGALVGFSVFSWLLRVRSAILANSFSLVSPAVAVLLGWLILGEPLTARTLAASAVILVGVALIVTATASHMRQNQSKVQFP